MFSVKNIIQNIKLIELWSKIWHHYIKLIFLIFPIGHNVKVQVIQIQRIMTISKILAG